MPKLNKVIAGLALSAALGGGALAASATAASASTAPTGWGWGNPVTNEFNNGFNNTFENSPVLNEACSGGCFQGGCLDSSDLDDILWDVCVAGNCPDLLPGLLGCVN
ncbi:hypothetical protein [Microbispora sp. H11081]|uniref:hypothetical protein n=1 Tax=Microbispora sp. H11081 TaxID=2729107 RepID=UPI001475627D|nr:hypothetical protein [Microbispora sp. H11081]